MVLIYIRHARDDTRSALKTGTVNDAPLYDKSKGSCKNLGKKLLKKYGTPKKIFTSPFLRCKETVKYMLEGNNELITSNISVEPDLRISKWFPTDQKFNPQITDKTQKYGVAITEDYEEFKKRVKQHCVSMKKYARSDNIYWCITHAIVFKKIHEYFFGDKGYDHVKSLENFIVDE